MMRRLLKALTPLVLLSISATAQTQFSGSWQGSATNGQSKIYLTLFIAPPVNGKYTGALMLGQNRTLRTLDSLTLSRNEITFAIKAQHLTFTGSLSSDKSEIEGTLKQGEWSPQLRLRRDEGPDTSVTDAYEKQELMVPMRDGVKLHTILFKPKRQKENLPFLIERSPYGFGGVNQTINAAFRELAADGYYFVFQDVRGRYASEGQWVLQRPIRDQSDPKSIDEATDTYDTIEWLLKNVPRNNGRAGIFGISYGGWLTEMALIEPHPALKAASEQASPADMFLGDDFHHNGAFRLSYGFEYSAMMETGKENQTFQFKQYDTYDFYLRLGPLNQANARYFDGQRPTWNTFIAHPNYDEYWKKQAVQSYVGKGRVPNLNVGGAFDQEDFAGPWRIFAASETAEASKYNYMVVGPWNHGGWAAGRGRSLGKIDFGSDTGKYFRTEIQAKWFAWWLKDKGTAPATRIQLFETGSNQWRNYSEWPPRDSQPKPLYLHPNGEASFDPPTSSAYTEYISDPARPVPYRERPIPETYGGAPGWATWHVDDQRFADTRPDVAVWKSKPLDADLRIAGDILARLVASTSGTDSDWVVKLIDVYPENNPEDPPLGGYELMVIGDVLRGRFRNGFEKPEPTTPHTPTEIQVDLLSRNHVFKKGHRVMVQIQSTWFPLIDRNPQSFVPNIFEAKESDFIKATQRIYPKSNILLPVIPN